jgi:hypothetical protein
MRVVRVALLVVLLGAGTAFHHTGAAYTTIRVAYYAVILGGLGYVLWRRSGAQRRSPTAAPGAPAPEGPGPWSPPKQVQAPGWYPDLRDMSLQRYWDGSVWTTTRRWDGTTWIEDTQP